MGKIEEIKKRFNNYKKSNSYDEGEATYNKLIDESPNDIEYLLSRLEIATESLQQIKYEYEQGQDDKVASRMYKEATEALHQIHE